MSGTGLACDEAGPGSHIDRSTDAQNKIDESARLAAGCAAIAMALLAAACSSGSSSNALSTGASTLAAVYVLATGVQGLQFVTSVQWLSDLLNGVTVIGAVGLAVWRLKARVRAEAALSPGAASLSSSANSDDGRPAQPSGTVADRSPAAGRILSWRTSGGRR